jgi:hypothetical protein
MKYIEQFECHDQNNLSFRLKQWSGRLEHLLKVSKTVDDDKQLTMINSWQQFF